MDDARTETETIEVARVAFGWPAVLSCTDDGYRIHVPGRTRHDSITVDTDHWGQVLRVHGRTGSWDVQAEASRACGRLASL